MDFFVQIPFTLPQHIGAGTSSSTTSQQPAQESAPPAETSKGKEVLHSEQETMADQPDASKEQGPSTQTKVPEILVLQTPLYEERAKKRDRQQETPTGGSTEQQGEKRQRLNPYSEEELPEGTTGQEAPSVLETSTSSLQQGQERQHGVEVTSTRQQSKQGSDIKKAFTKIKARNEPLRLQLYNQLLRMAPTNQQRLMAAYDIQDGKMTLSHFRPTMQQPPSAADYIRTNLEVLSKDIHPMDQIELHKQTGDMVYSTLANKALLAHRLQNSLHNTSAQLELEKASSLAKDNRIKSLEEIIMELGHDPKDPKGIQALIKKKEEDIVALRKQLRLPITMHP